MTGEEQRQIAYGYLNGTDGLAKNEKKGWECMKQAADLGDAEACFEYAAHIVDKDYNAAINYIGKGNLAAQIEHGECRYVGTYWKALLLRAKAEPATAKDGYNKAVAYADDYARDRGNFGNGWYNIAELAHRAGADKAEVKKFLVNATIGENDVADNATYAAYGMEKGVLEGKAALERYLSKYAGSVYKRKVFFAVVKKQESLARALVEATLDDKAGKKLGKKRIAKIKASSAQGVLEYQKVLGQTEYLGAFTYGFRHQASNSITYTTGSGEIDIDTEYITYGATFKCGVLNNDLNAWIDSMEFSNELPDARVRITVERESDVSRGASRRQVSSYDVIKEKIAKKYNWYSSDISLTDVHGVGDNYRESGREDIYIPFWFFNYNIDGETVTARVNAFNGEVDFFINNAFGQLTATDNAEKGGNRIDLDSPAVSGKFSWGIFILLTVLTMFGGALYVLVWAATNIKNKLSKK